MKRTQVGQIQVADELHRFIIDEALPGSGITPQAFWAGVDDIVHAFSPRTRALLARRDELQSQIDDFHRAAPGQPDPEGYVSFLFDIGYLLEEPDDFEVTTSGVDVEISHQAGPQLVVPLLNARFAINAANARWGSLYDALYGTDVVPDEGTLARGVAYNPVRGAEVIARGRALLDRYVPLVGGSHTNAGSYCVDADGLIVIIDGTGYRLAIPSQFVGHRGSREEPDAIVLAHHGLHLEIIIDPDHPIGVIDSASVSDIVLESAVSTIMDLEDSVAAVDVGDKVAGYRNWLKLMQGTLAEPVTKAGQTFVRAMNPDRTCTSLSGETVSLPGRALLFIRQVGHLMTSDAVVDRDGSEVPEGILDALVTVLGSMHDLAGRGVLANSRAGSVYIVKPKMHGPEEVALTCELFSRIEVAFGLAPDTLKLGIMDEERRTTLNLKACLYAARDRLAFINTGFLDRTGDEIHTSMYAGPVVLKDDMRNSTWIQAYEDSNVDIGIACGLPGRAQIGKGMWAAPDNMAEMLEKKIVHPESGASCAWVPSPTAATLHAIHYHQVDVHARQRELAGLVRSSRAALLSIPLGSAADWTPEECQLELDNNIQGVLGYVVRWIDAGVGCSKVPDIHGVPLMEDRATCRISSQHVANWLLHGVVTLDEVEETLQRMAAVVDRQNDGVHGYVPMTPGLEGEAFMAARSLIIDGLTQPSGYTEPILHRRRLTRKSQEANA